MAQMDGAVGPMPACEAPHCAGQSWVGREGTWSPPPVPPIQVNSKDSKTSKFKLGLLGLYEGTFFKLRV